MKYHNWFTLLYFNRNLANMNAEDAQFLILNTTHG